MSFEGKNKTEQLRIATAKPFATDLLVGIDTAQHGDRGLACEAEGPLMWKTNILRQKELLFCWAPQGASSGLAVLEIRKAWLCAEQRLSKRGTGLCQIKSFL